MSELGLKLQASDQIVDDEGRPTLSFQRKWQELVNRLEAAETTIADHETRITALEP